MNPPLPTSKIIPFTYMFQPLTLAALAPGTSTLQMAADSAFELLRMLGISSLDNPTDIAPNNFSVQLIDQSTGQQLTSGQVPQAMYCTRSYQWGNDEKYAIQFPAQSIVIGSFVNLQNAQITINFGLKGYKIFQAKL